MITNQMQFDSMGASHLPVLALVVDNTEGPILELGMGNYSTTLLDLMCHETKRLLVSYEDDLAWYLKNRDWESDYHKVYLVDNYDQADIESIHWSVAFVDHKPGLRRNSEIKRLANIADYVIVHDTEPQSEKDYQYSKVYGLFKYRHDYTKCYPNTTILSNFFDPKKFYRKA